MANGTGNNGGPGYHPGGTPNTAMFNKIHSRNNDGRFGAAARLVGGILESAALAPENPAAAAVTMTKTLVEAAESSKDDDES
jgi:hypothetical protein